MNSLLITTHILLMIVFSANGSHVVTRVDHYPTKPACTQAANEAVLLNRGTVPTLSFLCVPAGSIK